MTGAAPHGAASIRSSFRTPCAPGHLRRTPPLTCFWLGVLPNERPLGTGRTTRAMPRAASRTPSTRRSQLTISFQPANVRLTT
jgi:hypothetical protein